MLSSMTAMTLTTLINERLAELGITKHELVVRLRYDNINKGLRRLQSVIGGDLDGCADILPKLAGALQTHPDAVLRAIQATREEQQRDRVRAEEEREREWARAFTPHAIILTERTVPSPMVACAMTMGERNLLIELDQTRPRRTYVHQALSESNGRLVRFGGEIPFFG
jgi:hypothetical protein